MAGGARRGATGRRRSPDGPADRRPAAGRAARVPDEHGRGRREERTDQGLPVQAGTRPGQRLRGVADQAVRRAWHLGRLAVPGGQGRGGQERARPPINFGGRKMREYLLTPAGEKRVQAILSYIEPGGGSGDEPYSLPTDVEFVFVLAGQLRVVVAGEQSCSARATRSPSRPGAHLPGPAVGRAAGALGVLARPARPRARAPAARRLALMFLGCGSLGVRSGGWHAARESRPQRPHPHHRPPPGPAPAPGSHGDAPSWWSAGPCGARRLPGRSRRVDRHLPGGGGAVVAGEFGGQVERHGYRQDVDGAVVVRGAPDPVGGQGGGGALPELPSAGGVEVAASGLAPRAPRS